MIVKILIPTKPDRKTFKIGSTQFKLNEEITIPQSIYNMMMSMTTKNSEEMTVKMYDIDVISMKDTPEPEPEIDEDEPLANIQMEDKSNPIPIEKQTSDNMPQRIANEIELFDVILSQVEESLERRRNNEPSSDSIAYAATAVYNKLSKQS